MPFEVHTTEQRRYFLRLDAAASAHVNPGLAPLLDQLIAQTQAEGVVVYRFDSVADEFLAISAQAAVTPRIPELGVTLTLDASVWFRRSREPLQFVPAEEARFSNLPEAFQYGFERLLIVPLRADDLVLGFLTLGRKDPRPFTAGELHNALQLAHVVAVVMERDALQAALKERKLVERAKGILQQKRRLSEESAYLFLRETSRRLRLPMADIARDVIRSGLATRHPALG
ncbi:MAG: GAF and ANTAR domain-containing protein, partial [Acidobacteriota bacterium]